MTPILEGRLAAQRAYAILSAARDNLANPYGGNASGLKAAMRSIVNLEGKDEQFSLGFEAEAEQIRKAIYRLTESRSWLQQ